MTLRKSNVVIKNSRARITRAGTQIVPDPAIGQTDTVANIQRYDAAFNPTYPTGEGMDSDDIPTYRVRVDVSPVFPERGDILTITVCRAAPYLIGVPLQIIRTLPDFGSLYSNVVYVKRKVEI